MKDECGKRDHIVTAETTSFAHALIDQLAQCIAKEDIGRGDLKTCKDLCVSLRNAALRTWPDFGAAAKSVLPSDYA